MAFVDRLGPDAQAVDVAFDGVVVIARVGDSPGVVKPLAGFDLVLFSHSDRIFGFFGGLWLVLRHMLLAIVCCASVVEQADSDRLHTSANLAYNGVLYRTRIISRCKDLSTSMMASIRL